MRDKIDDAKKAGDTIGGVVQTVIEGVPVGVGSYVHYDRKLDGRIAQGVVSINAFKGVSFGEGFKAAEKPGSEVQDEILYDKESFKASVERSDSCAVPAASVVVENVVAFELAKALLEEFQCNHIDQLKTQIEERRLLNIEY